MAKIQRLKYNRELLPLQPKFYGYDISFLGDETRYFFILWSQGPSKYKQKSSDQSNTLNVFNFQRQSYSIEIQRDMSEGSLLSPYINRTSLLQQIKKNMNFLCRANLQKEYFAQGYKMMVQHHLKSSPSLFIQEEDKGFQNAKAKNKPIPNSFSSDPNYFAEPQSVVRLSELQTQINLGQRSKQALLSKFEMAKGKKLSKQQIKFILFDKSEWLGVQKSANYLIRMIEKSNYDSILTQKGKKTSKRADHSFIKKDIFSLQMNGSNISKPLKWLNLNDLSEKQDTKFCFIDPNYSPKDIVQGNLVGDCYFLSAIASIATNKDRILRLFSSYQINANGMYMSKIMFKGIIREVIVDDYFPTYIDKEAKQQFLGCRPHPSTQQIYPLILEKCWAKLWGSYEAIDGGRPHEALHALTGAPTKTYILKYQTSTPQKYQSFFEQIKGYLENNYLLCAGSFSDSKVAKVMLNQNKNKMINIEKSHIYSVVTDSTLFQKEKSLRLYNPWGYNKQHQNSNHCQGLVKIEWNQFIQKYQYLTVCKINDNANYLYVQLEDCKPDKLKFMELEIKQVGVNPYCAITLSQTQRRETEGSNHQYISVTFIVLKEGPQGEYIFETVRTQSLYSDHYLELNNLTTGKYLIALLLQTPEITESLTLGVYSEAVFGFSQKEVSRDFEEHFLSRALVGYDKSKSHHRFYPQKDNKNIWVSFQALIEDSNLGYLLLHVEKSQKQTYQLGFGKNNFTSRGLTFYDPYNVEAIRIKASPGFETIAVFHIDRDTFFGNITNQVSKERVLEPIFNSSKKGFA